MKIRLIQFTKGNDPNKKAWCCVQLYIASAIIMIHLGLKRFRRFNESRSVIQVKSESTLVNKGSNLKIHANNIVPFARKRALVAAA